VGTLSFRDTGPDHTCGMPPENYDVPEWDEILNQSDSVVGLCRIAASQVALDCSENTLIVKAATLRAAQLLESLAKLVRTGQMAALGILIRSMYETWLAGQYAGLGGDAERMKMVEQYDFEVNVMSEYVPNVDARHNSGVKMTIWDYAEAVRDLLQERDHPLSQFPVDAWNILYRYESLTSVHAGLGSLGLESTDDDARIVQERVGAAEPSYRHRFLLAMSVVISMASLLTWTLQLERSGIMELEEWIVRLNPNA
jgi:hypothetical protein